MAFFEIFIGFTFVFFLSFYKGKSAIIKQITENKARSMNFKDELKNTLRLGTFSIGEWRKLGMFLEESTKIIWRIKV